MIFIATTGRSGTTTLVDIFNTLTDCYAEHEPYPLMNDDVLRRYQVGDVSHSKKVYDYIKSINLWRSLAKNSFYMDSNHLFIKTYYEYALNEFGDKALVIHLKRNSVDVANSIYCLGSYPGTLDGNNWWLNHKSKDNVIQIAGILESDPELSHPFYKCLWYFYEIEERIKILKKKYANKIQIAELSTAQLNDKHILREFFHVMGVDVKSEIKIVKSNTKSDIKKMEPLETDLAKSMDLKFSQKLEKLGY